MNKVELKKKYKDEQVYCLSYNVVENYNDKFTPMKHDNNIYTKYDNIGKFLPRWEVEGESSIQQLIPYVIITNEDNSKYYTAIRLGGDNRLKSKYSLGFGGHINPCDGPVGLIINNINRELNEELNFEKHSPLTLLGTIRDLESETNDHFGLVFLIKIPEKDLSIKEIDNLKGEWMTEEELYSNFTKFERWSKYIIDYIYDLSLDKKKEK